MSHSSYGGQGDRGMKEEARGRGEQTKGDSLTKLRRDKDGGSLRGDEEESKENGEGKEKKGLICTQHAPVIDAL